MNTGFAESKMSRPYVLYTGAKSEGKMYTVSIKSNDFMELV